MLLPIGRVLHAAVLSLTFASASLLVAAPSGELAERIDHTPDLPQNDETLPGRGSQYCGPVAASNALVWLAGRGYPQLLPGSQLDLARTLGSAELMNTAKKRGTGSRALVSGLVRYVEDRGYEIDQITYYGWHKVRGDSVRAVRGHPDAIAVARKLDSNSIGLLNIGWYKQEGDDFQRTGGHWVTLLGADPDQPSTLVVHDPARRSPEGKHERMTVTRIETGHLSDPQRSTEREADGAWQLGGELSINNRSGATTSVLDNAVLLRLK